MSRSEGIITSAETPEATTICIVGLGYVGLPLGIAFDAAGYETIGFDIDTDRIAAYNGGEDPTNGVGHERIQSSEMAFTDDPSAFETSDYILITVPTPLDKVQNPKLKFVRLAAKTIGEYITPGTTVVLESTVYPGVTRDVVAPIIERESGFTQPSDFNIGYSPERLSPGAEGRALEDAVKIVGADTDETLTRLTNLYESIIDAGVYQAPSIETAEAAKVLENVQRDLNIALMNEMAIICDHLDLDTHEVIKAAATKWNFHVYTPGLVGGHCIPVDPLYLVHGSKRAGFSPNLILQAREINEYMPKHVAELVMKGLNRGGKVLRDSRLLVLGISYKPNVSDVRTSEVTSVIRALEEYEVECLVYDPVASAEQLEREVEVSTTPSPVFEGIDGILLATPHDEFLEMDFDAVADETADNPTFIDVYGAMDRDEITDAGFDYRRL